MSFFYILENYASFILSSEYRELENYLEIEIPLKLSRIFHHQDLSKPIFPYNFCPIRFGRSNRKLFMSREIPEMSQFLISIILQLFMDTLVQWRTLLMHSLTSMFYIRLIIRTSSIIAKSQKNWIIFWFWITKTWKWFAIWRSINYLHSLQIQIFQDLKQSIKTVAAFLNVSIDRENLERLVDHLSFEKMKSIRLPKNFLIKLNLSFKYFSK